MDLTPCSPDEPGIHGQRCLSCDTSHGIEMIAWCIHCDDAVCTFCRIDLRPVTQVVCRRCETEETP